MSKKGKRWMSFDEVPEEVQPLLMAFHQVFGLHHTSNVVRYMQGDYPCVQVQRYGRIGTSELHALEEEAGCLVEIQGRAPGYSMIMMWGGQQSAYESRYNEATKPNFLYRPL